MYLKYIQNVEMYPNTFIMYPNTLKMYPVKSNSKFKPKHLEERNWFQIHLEYIQNVFDSLFGKKAERSKVGVFQPSDIYDQKVTNVLTCSFFCSCLVSKTHFRAGFLQPFGDQIWAWVGHGSSWMDWSRLQRQKKRNCTTLIWL